MVKEEDWMFAERIEASIGEALSAIDRLADRNQAKVLEAFSEEQIADTHLFGSTGYGYDDRGREKLDALFARVFGAQAGLVRPMIVSGTHALSLGLFALLRPGDHLLYVTGMPYDTLHSVIGLRGEGQGSLREFGVTFDAVALCEDGTPDYEAIGKAINKNTKVVAIQRSAGYAWRPALTMKQIAKIVEVVKKAAPKCLTFVDNCYGEFTDFVEPPEVGVDLTVGSLIKNPGGGLAPTGGYLVGTKVAIEQVAYRLTAPGIGAECGSYENYRLFYQGLFIAPHTVAQALKCNLFAAKALSEAGFSCAPKVSEPRNDIVLRIALQSAKNLVAFCQAIQRCSPIDSHVIPEPWPMPGYADPVIMAAGAFVQGSSIELSADGPLREPYIAYLQGGLTYSHGKIAILQAIRDLKAVTFRD